MAIPTTFSGSYVGTSGHNALWVPAPARTTNGTYTTYQFTFDGLGGNDTLVGSGGPTNWTVFNSTGDPLQPLTITNWLIGGEGNDQLFSSFRLPGLTVDQTAIYSRADTLEGGDGDDRYFLRDDNVTVVEGDGANSGRDTILLTDGYFTLTGLSSFELPGYVNVENLLLLGTTGRDLGGSTVANLIRGGVGADTVNGQDGNDTLSGGAGNDVLNGNNDNDVVYAGAGADVVYGGTEADTMLGGTGHDTLYGDDGHDSLFGGDDNDLMDGGADNDTLLGSNGNDTLDGGIGDDSLRGDAGNDQFFGGDGNDRVVALLGDDVVDAGGEADYILIDSASDMVDGGDGVDTVASWSINLVIGAYDNVEALQLIGNANRNIDGAGSSVALTLTGNAGRNLIDGSVHDDTMFGDSGNDSLFGSDGFDSLTGGSGNDSLFGGNDGDMLDGSSGSDRLFGGDGDDNIHIDSATDSVFGGDGYDRLLTSTLNIVVADHDGIETVELEGSLDLNIDGSTSLYGLSLLGNLGNNRIDGSVEADYLCGRGGDDSIYGRTGDDDLYGGSDNDTLYGGEGDDYLYGAGNDVALGSDGTSVLYGGDGDDFVTVENTGDAAYGGADYDTLETETLNITVTDYDDFEAVTLYGSLDLTIDASGSLFGMFLVGNDGNNQIAGSDHDDFIADGGGNDTFYGNDGNDLILVNFFLGGASEAFGGAGNDIIGSIFGDTTLYGDAGDDSLGGGEGNDQLFGGADNDVLDGSLGDDTMAGGEGDDLYWVLGLDDIVTEDAGFGTGYDTVSSGDINLTATDYANVEALTLTGTDDLNIDASGVTHEVYLVGNAGNNVLTGGTDSDEIYSGDGNDSVVGGAGADRLWDDGLGDDTFEGGNDADTFIFTMASQGNTDTILDFAPGSDKIDLTYTMIEEILYGPIVGNAHADDGIGSAYAVDNPSGSWTIYLDYDGNGTNDHTIEIYNVAFDLSSADFVIRRFDGSTEPFI